MERLVQETESLYSVVKENGIKSTVNFQLKWLNNLKKQEESLPDISENLAKKKVTFEEKTEKTSL